MKNNTMSLSVGYLTVMSERRDDGINELHELDPFEVSIVPAPANADTRIFEMTSINDDGLADLRAQSRDQMHALLTASTPRREGQPHRTRARADPDRELRMLTNDYAEAIASWTQYYEANPQPHATASRTWQSTAHPKATPQRGSARPSPSHDTSTDAHTGATSATAPNAPHRNGSHHDHTGRVGQPTTAHGYRRVARLKEIQYLSMGPK
jgi:hypothetical protein